MKDESVWKIFDEFNPYFCYAVMSCLPEFKANFDKSNFVYYLKEKYQSDNDFEKRCKKHLIEPFISTRQIEKNVLKRIRDLNLLYTLKFSYEPNLKIEGKVTGRALELIIEAILKSELKGNNKLSYEFVDWKSLDYVLVDNVTNDWIAGIQSKIAIVPYKKTIQEIIEFTKIFPSDKKLIMLCGGASSSKKKMELKQVFETEGWELYYLWTDIDEYDIDESFYGFIDAIATYGQK